MADEKDDAPIHQEANEDAARTAAADEMAEALHNELMARLVEAMYIQAITLLKVTNLPPRHIPRLLFCAATHGIEKSMSNYARREELAAAGTAPFPRQERAGHHTRILEDIAELEAVLTEGGESLKQIRAAFTVPTSTLIS